MSEDIGEEDLQLSDEDEEPITAQKVFKLNMRLLNVFV